MAEMAEKTGSGHPLKSHPKPTQVLPFRRHGKSQQNQNVDIMLVTWLNSTVFLFDLGFISVLY
jgi:hypothetical protein